MWEHPNLNKSTCHYHSSGVNKKFRLRTHEIDCRKLTSLRLSLSRSMRFQQPPPPTATIMSKTTCAFYSLSSSFPERIIIVNNFPVRRLSRLCFTYLQFSVSNNNNNQNALFPQLASLQAQMAPTKIGSHIYTLPTVIPVDHEMNSRCASSLQPFTMRTTLTRISAIYTIQYHFFSFCLSNKKSWLHIQ